MSFELLESIFLDELDDIVDWNIDQISELGIDIEIDDFGTGHASIVSLLKLRPQRLQDRPAVRRADRRPRRRSGSWSARSSISASRSASRSSPKASRPWNRRRSSANSAAISCRAMPSPGRCRPRNLEVSSEATAGTARRTCKGLGLRIAVRHGYIRSCDAQAPLRLVFLRFALSLAATPAFALCPSYPDNAPTSNVENRTALALCHAARTCHATEQAARAAPSRPRSAISRSRSAPAHPAAAGAGPTGRRF